MSAWGVRVQEVRRKLGITQVEMSRKMHVSKQTIVMWERSMYRPYSRLAERFERLEEMVESGEYTMLADEDWMEVLSVGVE